MKKNVDQMTSKLYNAAKAAYLREFSGIIRNNGKCQPVTVDMMAQLANGHSVDGLALAEGTNTLTVIELMPGYSCSLASLPRIYKQVARLAGETCEKIAVGGAVLNAYGLTDEQLNAKENKKIIAVLKKYCPAPKKNDRRDISSWKMGVYHDSSRRCAVWSDARIMIVAPWLYNDAVAGQTVAADGTKITDYNGQPVKYPNWVPVVPDMSYKSAKAKKFDVYSVNAARVAENAASVATAVKGVKKAKDYFVAARYASDGGIVAFAHDFAPWFSLVNSDLYFQNAHTAAVGYVRTAAGNGFILFMPKMLSGITPESRQNEIDRYADNKTIYADAENDIYIKNRLPQAAADSLPLPFLAVCPEVNTPAEPVAEVVEVPAEPVAEVVEVPAEPVAEVVETPAEPVAEVVEAPAEPVTEAVDYMETDNLPDNTPIYTADDVAHMIEAATADTYTADEVADIVAAAVAEERAKHTRRHFAPRLLPILRRLRRLAAVVLPLLIMALFIGSSTASTASTPAADTDGEAVAQVVELPAVTVTASSLTDAPAADTDGETVAQVVELPAVTVTASSLTTTPAIPSPVKNAADDAGSLTTAPATPIAPAAVADGLTICAGTAWTYTMMNWA